MDSQTMRWEQRFVNFRKALAKLAEVAEAEAVTGLSELEKEDLIQRFEYTYELAWKTLQDFLRSKGYVDIAGPAPVLTQAFQDEYIGDGEGWRQMKKTRELTPHTFDCDTADEIAQAIVASYYKLLKQLEQWLEQDRSGTQLPLF